VITRLQFHDPAKEGCGTWNIAIEEVVSECLDVECAVKTWELNERFDLRPEQKRAWPGSEEQRLLAESIASKHKPLRVICVDTPPTM